MNKEREQYQLAGLDDRERGFSRPVACERAGDGHRAVLRYETARIATDPQPTPDSALLDLIQTLHARGYRQLKTQMSFRNGTYLGSQELWVEYPDPRDPLWSGPDHREVGALVASRSIRRAFMSFVPLHQLRSSRSDSVIVDGPQQAATGKPRLPSWFKVTAQTGRDYLDIKQTIDRLQLHTICQEARCPNRWECWNARAATFLILGDICTRRCHYCSFATGKLLQSTRGNRNCGRSRAVLGPRHASSRRSIGMNWRWGRCNLCGDDRG